MIPTPLPALSANTRRTVLLLSLACFCSMATQRICDAMLPELAREFGASMARTGQVVSLFAVVYGLAQLLYGAAGDRLGKLRVLTFTTVASGAGSLMAVFAGSLDALVLARVLMALVVAAIIPMSIAWTGDAVPYAMRQETLARVGLGTTMGIMGGQLMGGVFVDTVGWRWAFVLMAVLFLGVGALLWRDMGQQVASPVSDQPPRGIWEQTRELLSEPWVRTLLAVSMVQGGAGFGLVAIIATHLHEVHGLALSSAGATVAMFGLGGMLYMSQAKPLIRKLGEHGLALVGGCTLGAALLTVAFSPWWLLAPPAMLVAGFAFFMLHNTLQANATQMAPQARGLGVSMFATALFSGQALGVLVATSLIGPLGSSAVLAGGAVAMVSMAVFLSAQLRRRHRLKLNG
jgi:predicted MFS family arabinose efflux permease